MARFSLTLLIDIEALDHAEESGVEVLALEPYTNTTENVAQVTLAADNLRAFAAVMDYDAGYSGDDTSDVILNAVIID